MFKEPIKQPTEVENHDSRGLGNRRRGDGSSGGFWFMRIAVFLWGIMLLGTGIGMLVDISHKNPLVQPWDTEIAFSVIFSGLGFILVGINK